MSTVFVKQVMDRIFLTWNLSSNFVIAKLLFTLSLLSFLKFGLFVYVR